MSDDPYNDPVNVKLRASSQRLKAALEYMRRGIPTPVEPHTDELVLATLIDRAETRERRAKTACFVLCTVFNALVLGVLWGIVFK